MTSRRRRQGFRKHARRLGIPDAVSGYLMDAVGEGTDVPALLRRAARIGAADGLDPDGLAAQVRKLLAWDYRERPGDYASDPRGEPIPTHRKGARPAGPARGSGPGRRTGPDGDRDAPPGNSQWYTGMLARRALVAVSCLFGHVLPAHGTHYDRCGKYTVQGCLDHADGGRRSRTVRWWCYRLSCPVCYGAAIRAGAIRGARRLMAGSILRNSPLGPGRRRFIYHHLVVSVGPSRRGLLNTPEGVDRCRREIYKRMKWLGYRGGAVIYHQWSFGGGRQRYRPHFHVIAAGYVDRDRYLDRYGRRIMVGKMDSDPIREVNRQTGDVYRKVSHAGSGEEVCSILYYLLTHVSLRIPGDSRPGAGRSNHGQAITYFGDVAPGKFSTRTVLTSSRDAGRDIGRIVREWLRRADALEMSASIQLVVCPPRGGAARRGEPCGSIFDVDVRTAGYGAVSRMPLAEAEGHLRSLAARGDNAPPAESVGGGIPGGPAPKPRMYAVVHLEHYERCGGVRARYYAVIALDPSMANLCPECRGSLRTIVRVDGGGIPPPDGDHPEGVLCTHDDAAEWTYYRPRGEHAGMGVPYYEEDGLPRRDKGVPNMPADARSLPPEYRSCLLEQVEDRIVWCTTAAMRRRNPVINMVVARWAVRYHLARAGLPDKTQDDWEDTLLAGAWAEYANLTGTAGPPGGGAPG